MAAAPRLPQAAKGGDDVNLNVKGEADLSHILDSVRHMGSEWNRNMRVIEKQTERATDGMFGDFKKFYWKVAGAKKAYEKLYEKTLKKENEQEAKLNEQLKINKETIEETTKELKELQAVMGKKLDPEAIEKLKRELEGLEDKKVDIEIAKGEVHEGSKSIKEKFELDPKDIDETASRLGEVISDVVVKPMELVFRKDLPGAIKGLSSQLGKGMMRGSGKLGEWAEKLSAKAAKKKDEGAGGQAYMLKSLGGALGDVAGVLKSIGPMLSMVGGLVVGLVQMFLEADAAVKDFSKDIMATSGSAEFLNRSVSGGTEAAGELQSTLKEIYHQATSLDNLKWGITKEQYSATISALTAEGQSLLMLTDKYKTTQGEIRNFGSLVRTSVAYSSAFGVSLQEISQFEGEMMTQMGSDFDDVESSFQSMLRGAEEAGIATNKFFEVIRGFSADLTMFTLRMEDITHVMTALGRAMSPREAQKFLQSVTGAFKGKGLADLSKEVLMAGGTKKVGGVLQESFDKKLIGLAAKIAKETGKTVDPKTLKKYMKGDRKELAKWLNEDMMGASEDSRKAVTDAANQQSRLTKGGLVDVASALSEADPMTAMKVMATKVQNFTGKKIEDLTNIERLAAESALGISDEQQKGFAKMSAGVEDMRAGLIAKLKKTDELNKELTKTKDPTRVRDIQNQIKALKLTKDEKTAMENLAAQNAQEQALLQEQITATKDPKQRKAMEDKLAKLKALQGASLVEAKSADDVWAAMSESQKTLLAEGTEQVNYAKQTAGLTTSINTQLQIIADFLMGVFYNTVMKIKSLIVKFTGGQDEEDAEMAKLEKEAVTNKDQQMLKVLRESGGSLDGVRDAIAKQWQEQQRTALEGVKDKDEQDKILENLQKQWEQKTGPQLKAIVDAQNRVEKASAANTAALVGGVLAGPIGYEVGKTLGPVLQDMAHNSGLTESGGGVTGDIGYTAPASGKAPKQVEYSGGDDDTGQAVTDAMQSVDPDADKASQATIDQTNEMTHGTSIYTHDVHLEKLFNQSLNQDNKAASASEEFQEETEDQGGTLDDIWKALRVRGIKIDKPFLENTVKGVIKDAVYDAAGDALEDYYMLTHGNEAAVKKFLQGGGKNAGGMLRNASGKTDQEVLDRKASGGFVTGIHGGLAQVSPAPGEGLTSIGKGEAIVPAGGRGGGGGQVIELRLKGDLARIIDARAQNVVSNHETMKTKR